LKGKEGFLFSRKHRGKKVPSSKGIRLKGGCCSGIQKREKEKKRIFDFFFKGGCGNCLREGAGDDEYSSPKLS